MIRKIGMAVLLLSLAMPASAKPRCDRPYSPEMSDVKNTSDQQIATMREDVQAFIAASDVYQACVLKGANSDASFQRDAPKLIEANQREKQRVGNLFNALLRTHRQANAQAANSSDMALAAR